MLRVIPIKAFQDNYFWLFHDEGRREACIVDPGDAGPVLAWLEHNDMQLAAIFITHHHQDHTGGLPALLAQYPNLPVYGPESPGIPAITHILHQGDEITLFDVTFSILEVPGHTLDHIAYFTAEPVDDNRPALFCGDTLFAGGCGRVFEGTYTMMHQSVEKLAALPPETRVYCAHEYTLANLRFAQAVSPEDRPLQQRMEEVKALRARDIPTVPTSIELELATNPFLRCNEPALVSAAQAHSGQTLEDPAQVFSVIRQWKDSF